MAIFKSLRQAAASAWVLALLTSGARAEPAGTLHYGTMIQHDNWNTLVKSGQTYTGIAYEGLLRAGRDGFTLEPSLATSWRLTPTELELTLRPDVWFHDGMRFDAEAVKQNIEWIKRSGTQWAAGFANVSEIVIRDPLHITLRLSEPTPTLPQRLATRGAYIVSPAAIAIGSWTVESGTGPWVHDPVASQRGAKEVFNYFDRYWAPQDVGVKSIVMHVFQDPSTALNAVTTGYVQAIELDSSQLPGAEAAGMKIKATPTLVQHMLFLDRKETFANENVRKAVCYAINIPAVALGGYNGYAKPVPQRFEAGQSGFDPTVRGYNHDPAVAKKFMAAAGNPKLSFTLPMYTGNQTAMMLISQQLRAIGIEAKPQLMTSGQYFTFYQTDKYPLQVNSSATENIGPLDYYQFRFATGGVGNPFRVAVPELDAIARRALTETTEEGQNKIWQEMTRYIHDRALDCGYYQWQTTWAYDPKKLDELPTIPMRPSTLRYTDVRLKSDATQVKN